MLNKLKPSERLILMALRFSAEPQTADQICTATGISQRYNALAAIRVLTVAGLVIASATTPTTYNLAEALND